MLNLLTGLNLKIEYADHLSGNAQTMDISEAQAAVADHFGTDDQAFMIVLDGLVNALLRGVDDDAITDGIVFGYEKARPDYFVGHGMIYLLDSPYNVEPFSVELGFNSDAKEITRATILFGALGPTKFKLCSRPGRNLAEYVAIKARSGRPKIDFDWQYKFTLVDGEWVSEFLSQQHVGD